MRTYSLQKDTKIKRNAYKSRTYEMKEERVEGYIDGLESVKQAIYKILNTERFEYPVYSFSYGAELQRLVGKERPYVRAELKRIVTDALMTDDRIISVSCFEFEFSGDACTCSFSVESIFGAIGMNVEVKV